MPCIGILADITASPRYAANIVGASADAICACRALVVVVGGSGQDGILPGGALDLNFNPGELDLVWHMVGTSISSYGSRRQHAATLTEAPALDGIFIIGDPEQRLVDEALATGIPVGYFLQSSRNSPSVALSAHALDVNDDGSLDRSHNWLCQRFVAGCLS